MFSVGKNTIFVQVQRLLSKKEFLSSTKMFLLTDHAAVVAWVVLNTNSKRVFLSRLLSLVFLAFLVFTDFELRRYF